MVQKEEMRKNLLEDIDGYFMQLNYLKDLINVENDIVRNKEKLQCASTFTLLVECALSDSYMLVLMRLYDKSEKAKTIPNLIEKCKKNLSLFPSCEDTSLKLKEFETKIKEDEFISHAIKTIRERRDSIYVHNDNKYFGNKLQNDETYLKHYHICILTKFTEEVLEYLFSQLSSEKPRETKYDNDLINIITHQLSE